VVLITGCQVVPVEAPAATDPSQGTATPEPLVPTSSPAAEAAAPTLEPFGPQVRITPARDLFVQSYGDEPEVRTDEWHLTIDGAVNEPLSLTYDEVRRLPAEDLVWTLECIGNPVGGSLIGNVVWTGTRLAPLLAQVGVRPEAVEVRLHAVDGYSTSVTVDRISHPDTVLAYEMNGYPLFREHGFPLRILIPGLYGQKMPKWLTRLEFIAEPYLGHFERAGWSNEATIRVNSQVERPAERATIPPGRAILSGIAHAGLAGVQQVEVTVSDAEGQNAIGLDVELLRGPNVYTWTQWRAFWDAEPGTYLIQAVATDGNGVRQEGAGSAFPNGTSGVHTESVLVTDGNG
jgi:DMSO/TMAO reductase YedYZ molybdopterin-dependent catalytic subunit